MKRDSYKRFLGVTLLAAFLLGTVVMTCVSAQEQPPPTGETKKGKWEAKLGVDVKSKHEWTVWLGLTFWKNGSVVIDGYNISWTYEGTASAEFLQTVNTNVDEIVIGALTEYIYPSGVPSFWTPGTTIVQLDPTQTSSGELNYTSMTMTLSLYQLASNSMYSPSAPIRITSNATGIFSMTPINATDLFFSATLHGDITLVFPSVVSVGGIAVPVGKFSLLGSYVGLVSTLAVAAVATAISVKRVKRKEEKQ